MNQASMVQTFEIAKDDREMHDLLSNVTYTCEASSMEFHTLWEQWSNKSIVIRKYKNDIIFEGERVEWTEKSYTYPLLTIGAILHRPICLSFRKIIIDGCLTVLFWNCTSQLKDYKMVDEWLAKYLPGIPNSDAQNFHNIVLTAKRMKRIIKL